MHKSETEKLIKKLNRDIDREKISMEESVKRFGLVADSILIDIENQEKPIDIKWLEGLSCDLFGINLNSDDFLKMRDEINEIDLHFDGDRIKSLKDKGFINEADFSQKILLEKTRYYNNLLFCMRVNIVYDYLYFKRDVKHAGVLFLGGTFWDHSFSSRILEIIKVEKKINRINKEGI